MKILFPIAILLPFSAQATTTFVFGDAFQADGLGDFNAPSSGTTGNAGVDQATVYNATTGTPGNPFNDGNPGGDFSPISVGNVFGTTYRSNIVFDLSGIAPAPAGFEYHVISVEFFIDVSSHDEQNDQAVDVGIFSDLGLPTGDLAPTFTPDATLTVPASGAEGTFVSTELPTSTADLNASSPSVDLILDVANPNVGARFGSGLSTADFPNTGINGTAFVQIAPRLVIEADLVPIPEPAPIIPEPGTLSVALLGALPLLCRRRRQVKP